MAMKYIEKKNRDLHPHNHSHFRRANANAQRESYASAMKRSELDQNRGHTTTTNNKPFALRATRPLFPDDDNQKGRYHNPTHSNPFFFLWSRSQACIVTHASPAAYSRMAFDTRPRAFTRQNFAVWLLSFRHKALPSALMRYGARSMRDGWLLGPQEPLQGQSGASTSACRSAIRMVALSRALTSSPASKKT
jgi:hypothetical protein